MDAEEFRVRGKEMVDYICDYMENIKDKRVTANVEPGYLKELLPTTAPQEPEDWAQIMSDVEDKIMPGITHWQHPRFHAYFPSGNSFPSILGDMLSDAIGCIGFSWAASPACTELETIVMDWFGQAIGLPDDFITSAKTSKGGGVIQSSASECVLVSMLAARNQAILHLKQARKHRQSTSKEADKNKTCNGNCALPEFDEVDFKSNKLDNKYKEYSEDDGQEEEQDYYENDSAYLPQLIAYCSKESHSCVEKAAMILLVKLRILDVDDNCSLRGHTLEKAMREDKARGLTPFFVSTTLGSTGCCSFDNLPEIGPICRAEPCTWFHVDAAYAGNAFICPELRPLMAGIEYADSFNTNPNKWLLVNFDCSCMWVKDRFRLTKALVVDPLYLQHANSSEAIDYRHWGIPLSRRFRSLKLWFVIRSYGLEGLQAYIRNHIRLAKLFEGLVRKDPRFEVVNDVRLGLVCFRLNGPDAFTRNLLAMINHSGLLHMIPSMVRSKYIIRFCVVAEHANEEDILHAWLTVKQQANELLPGVEKPLTPDNIARPPLTRQKSRAFSFTRSVSRELYKRSLSKGNLSDGATPILIPDDESNSPPGNEELLEEIVRAGRSDEEERQRRDGEQLAKELSECSVMDKQWLVDQV